MILVETLSNFFNKSYGQLGAEFEMANLTIAHKITLVTLSLFASINHSIIPLDQLAGSSHGVESTSIILCDYVDRTCIIHMIKPRQN